MPQTLTEGRHPGEFLLSEAAGTRSRDNVTIAQGTIIEPGTVLGKISASGAYGPFDPAATDGREVPAGIALYGADAAAAAVETAAIVRSAEVKAEALVWPDGITDAQRLAALDALQTDGIITR